MYVFIYFIWRDGELFLPCFFTLFFRAEGGRRRGYMGHLTRIANSIVHNSDKGPNGAQLQLLLSGEMDILIQGANEGSTWSLLPANVFLSSPELPEEDRDRWEAFTSGQLADTNKINTVDLVSALQSRVVNVSLEF